MAELVDALASGASGLTAVKVRVLSWAPFLCLQLFAIIQKCLKTLVTWEWCCPPIGTLEKKGWLLAFAFPAFGDRPVGEITARELLNLLREIEGRGLFETAKRLRSTCGMVFRYAIATQRAERDPSADLRGALTTIRSSIALQF